MKIFRFLKALDNHYNNVFSKVFLIVSLVIIVLFIIFSMPKKYVSFDNFVLFMITIISIRFLWYFCVDTFSWIKNSFLPTARSIAIEEFDLKETDNSKVTFR